MLENLAHTDGDVLTALEALEVQNVGASPSDQRSHENLILNPHVESSAESELLVIIPLRI